MRSIPTNYFEYLPHPGEPALDVEHHHGLPVGLRLATRHHLKRQVWNKTHPKEHGRHAIVPHLGFRH